MTNLKIIGSLCIIGTTICYGLVPALSFMAYDTGIVTETLLFDKFLYAAILMWAYILIKRIPFKLNRAAAKTMIFIMISYIGIATTLYFSFDYISGSLATIISFTFPAMVLAVEMIRGKEPVKLKKILAVVMSLTGLVCIVWAPGMEVNIIGVAFALGCAVCYTVYIISLGSDTLKDTNSLVTAGYVLLASAVFNFFRCFISGQPLFTENGEQLKFMLLLAVICAFAAILLNCLGIKLIGSSNASIINTFEPVFACIFGYILVGDLITTGMVIGGGLVVLAVLLANLPDKNSKLPDIQS